MSRKASWSAQILSQILLLNNDWFRRSCQQTNCNPFSYIFLSFKNHLILISIAKKLCLKYWSLFIIWRENSPTLSLSLSPVSIILESLQDVSQSDVQPWSFQSSQKSIPLPYPNSFYGHKLLMSLPDVSKISNDFYPHISSVSYHLWILLLHFSNYGSPHLLIQENPPPKKSPDLLRCLSIFSISIWHLPNTIWQPASNLPNWTSYILLELCIFCLAILYCGRHFLAESFSISTFQNLQKPLSTYVSRGVIICAFKESHSNMESLKRILPYLKFPIVIDHHENLLLFLFLSCHESSNFHIKSTQSLSLFRVILHLKFNGCHPS